MKKKLLALLLALAMLVSCMALLTGCSKDDDDDDDDRRKDKTEQVDDKKDKDDKDDKDDVKDDDDDKKPVQDDDDDKKPVQDDDDKKPVQDDGDEDGIVGDWSGDLNISGEFLSQTMSSEAGVEVNFSDMSVGVDLDLEDDGTFRMQVDKNSAEDFVRDLMPTLIDAYVTMMEEQTGMSLDEMLAAEDMTRSDFNEMLEEQLAQEDLAGGLTEGFNQSGSYELKDGQISMGGPYLDYTLRGDRLDIDTDQGFSLSLKRQ